MSATNLIKYEIFYIIPTILKAAFFLVVGIVNFISPDFSEITPIENVQICIAFFITAIFLIYAIFRPQTGGILLCITALLFIHTFHFQPLFYLTTAVIMLFGVLSIIRGRLLRQITTALVK